MDNNNKLHINLNPAILIAIIAQAVFMILVIITIARILNKKPEAPTIKIDNYTEIAKTATLEGALSDVDDEDKKVINSAIYEAASLNSKENIKSYGAKIREGATHNMYIEDLGIYYINFLVDIEDLGQTYRVVYQYVKNPPSYANFDNTLLATVYCPSNEDLIYGEFECHDQYKNNAEAQILYGLVKYKLFDGFTVGLIGNPSAGEKLSFHLNTSSDEPATKNKAITTLREYIESLGFNPDNYEYSASAYECCSL